MEFGSHEYFMNEALKEASKAFEENEVPVGAVVVCRGKIIARAYNQVEKLTDPTAHAEMLALTSASNAMGAKYLNECTLYVTLEPCVMCAGAMGWSQLGELVYGASDEKRGYTKLAPNSMHKKTTITSGILSSESEHLIKEFFDKLRN